MAEPGGRALVVVVAVVLAGLFAALPAWRGAGVPVVPANAVAPEAFEAKVEAMIKAYGTGASDEDGVPVVRPPEGDIYLVAERFRFRPALEVHAGGSYRLHVSSGDVMHGFHLGDVDLVLAPGIDQVVAFTPGKAGRMVVQCADFCGPLHSKMLSNLTVTEH